MVAWQISSITSKSSAFRAFQASKQPKIGRFWCGALVDELDWMVAWHQKFVAPHQNLPLFMLFKPRNSPKPEGFDY